MGGSRPMATGDGHFSGGPYIWKVGAAIVLFFLMFGGAALPAIIKDRADTPRVKAWIGIANMFSAGVFLGGVMIHLLPEANEKMNDAVDTSYPIAFVLSIVGFTFILMVEELVVWYQAYTLNQLECALENEANVPAADPNSFHASLLEEQTTKNLIARAQIIAAMNPRTSLLVDGQGAHKCEDDHSDLVDNILSAPRSLRKRRNKALSVCLHEDDNSAANRKQSRSLLVPSSATLAAHRQRSNSALGLDRSTGHIHNLDYCCPDQISQLQKKQESETKSAAAKQSDHGHSHGGAPCTGHGAAAEQADHGHGHGAAKQADHGAAKQAKQADHGHGHGAAKQAKQAKQADNGHGHGAAKQADHGHGNGAPKQSEHD